MTTSPAILTPPAASPDPTSSPAVAVPGCATLKPADLDVSDAEFRALDALDLADNVVVLHALRLFGPGVRVVEAQAGD